MSEYLLWKRKVKCHKENRPVNSVETHDIFSDKVQICRPVFLELPCAVSITIVSDSCDVVCQGIQPYIHNMLWIKVNRNSPCEGCSGHAQILKTWKKEIVHHLIFTRYRLNKFRMRVDIIDQTVSVFAHSEEICFFLRWFTFASTIRTFSVY